MKKTPRMVSLFFTSLLFGMTFFVPLVAAKKELKSLSKKTKTPSAPVGKETKVSFDKALPEDISNKNFPDVIESFDYPNADILDLVKAIGKLTGLNFIVDPAVSGKKITVIAPSKITVAEAYKAFLSALAINGYTVIKSGAFWKIQETKKALKDNTEIYSGDYFPNTDQIITRIIKFKHIDPKEFSDSIKYLLSQNNQISYHPSSNSIIISDYGSVIERIMKIVYEMDVPGSEEGVEIIPIRHAAAKDMANILGDLLSVKAGSSRRSLSLLSSRNRSLRRSKLSGSKKVSGNIKISNIIPDERTNSLVISANKEGLKRVKELVKKLDTYVDPSRTGGIYVYNVLYGTAEQVYNTLMGIGTSSSRKPSVSKPSTRFTTPGSRFSSQASSYKSSASPLFENVTIMADPNTNSLIISAKNKYDFERVKAVLKKIDVPKDQVFVQAVIVEMTVSDGDTWEINMAQILKEGSIGFMEKAMKFLNIEGAPIVGFLNKSLSPDIGTLRKLQFGPGFVLGAPLKGFLGGGGNSSGLSAKEYLSHLNDPSYKSLSEKDQANFRSAYDPNRDRSLDRLTNSAYLPLIQLLKSAGNVNVLSTPQITALDNTTASIEVGENAPVGLTSTATAGSFAQSSVDREDVTLKLEITPRINPDSETVQMDIVQKFDDFSARNSTASELQSKGVHIIKRNLETKLVLNNRETAVLGGLLIDKEVHNESKVPLLGDIPLLGWLFKGSTTTKEKRNLIVFITPTIIKGKDQKYQNRKLLGKKLEERIHFIKKHMKGRDPHGKFLKDLTSESVSWEEGRKLQEPVNPISPSYEESGGKEEGALQPEDFQPALPSEPEISSPLSEEENVISSPGSFESPEESLEGGEGESLESYEEGEEGETESSGGESESFQETGDAEGKETEDSSEIVQESDEKEENLKDTESKSTGDVLLEILPEFKDDQKEEKSE